MHLLSILLPVLGLRNQKDRIGLEEAIPNMMRLEKGITGMIIYDQKQIL